MSTTFLVSDTHFISNNAVLDAWIQKIPYPLGKKGAPVEEIVPEVGCVYYGKHATDGSYFFKYLGEGKWSSGHASLLRQSSWDTINKAANINYNKVTPLWKVTVFPEEICNKKDAHTINGKIYLTTAEQAITPSFWKEPVEVKAKKKYKIINHSSDKPLYREA